MRILIAESNKNLGSVLKQELEDAGLSADLVFNGIDAVQNVIEHHDYNFVLLNVLLPKLDGVNAMRLIKKINPTVKVIILSDSLLHADRNEFLIAGADRCFKKPCKIEKIMNYIGGLKQGQELPNS